MQYWGHDRQCDITGDPNCDIRSRSYAILPKQESMKSLFQLLKQEISKENLERIHNFYTQNRSDNVGFEVVMKVLLEKGKIEKDLKNLSRTMKLIKFIKFKSLRAYIFNYE